jgi:type VI secretion system protein ImpJ
VLREKIERLLDTLTVRNVTVIPLRKEAGGMLVGEVPEVAASSVVPFFLAATGDVSDTRLQAELPKKLKMASQEELPTLLASALPGVILTGPVVPPPGLQVLADRVYFRVETAGPLWDVVLRTRRVAVFCPPEYRSLTFSLYAVNDR